MHDSQRLTFTSPFNWSALAPAWARRATAGVEEIGPEYYRRTIELDGVQGVIEVRPAASHAHMQVTIDHPVQAAHPLIIERLRRMLDLDADIPAIAHQLGADPILAPAVAALPGLRVIGSWDTFELAVRTVLGQQISVAAATTLAGRLALAYGEPFLLPNPFADSTLRVIFPRPAVVAEADLSGLGITASRARTISALATAVAADPLFLQPSTDLAVDIERLCRLPGIGEWTAQYIAMRGFRAPDAFPASDLGLLKAMEHVERPMTKTRLLQVAEAWRPWRAYAAVYLWTAQPELLSGREATP